MVEELAGIALAGVLAGAALLKLAQPARSRAALATFGIPDRTSGPALFALIAVELGLAVWVVTGADLAAYAAAALMLGFASAEAVALRSGRGGAPCACFGAASRLSWAGVARDLLLAVAFAALPSIGAIDLSTDAWLGIGLGVALLACAGLGVAVFALAREVGMLRMQAGSRGALEIAGEGPALGARSAPLGERLAPQAHQLGLAVFVSDGCAICHQLGPSIQSLGAEPSLEVGLFEEVADAELWRALAIPGSPFALAFDESGTVLAKGTFNDLAQLESVIATAERRRAEPAINPEERVPVHV